MAYDSTLFVHIPIYLKLKEQPILDLFRTESYAIPYDPADLVSNEYGEWIGSYTKIEFEKEYMAIGVEIYCHSIKKIQITVKEEEDCFILRICFC